MNILDRIVETKRAEVARLTEPPPVFSPAVPRASFIEAIRRDRPAMIAEIKPKSPSAGPLLTADRIPGNHRGVQSFGHGDFRPLRHSLFRRRLRSACCDGLADREAAVGQGVHPRPASNRMGGRAWRTARSC